MARWTASNRGLALALELDGDGRLACSSLLDRATGRQWLAPGPASDELLVEVSCDGQRAVLTGSSSWILRGSERSTSGQWRLLVLRLAARGLPLEVRRTWALHERLPILRQWTVAVNAGDRPVLVHRIDTFRLRVAPAAGDLELSWVNNYCRGLKPSPSHPVHRRTVGLNIRHTIETGPYSPDCAWFFLGLPGTAEGIVGGWEWSGPMAVGFGDWDGPCLITGGLASDGMNEPLAPGASFTAPAGWLGFCHDGIEGAAELCHRFSECLSEVRPPSRDWPWLGYCTWASSLDGEGSPSVERGTHPWFPTEANVLSQIDAASSLGLDLFILDYGWFPRVGDWWCDPDRFPGGPKRVVRAVKDRGMKLGLWMGFASADPAARVVREHPGWLATFGGKPIPEAFPIRSSAEVWNTRVLCLGHRPAVDWILGQCHGAIEAFEVDWFKHDFDTVTLCQSSRHTHTAGDGRIACVEGYYRVLEELHRRHPAMIIDNWESDSALPDHGMLARHHVHLIGDAYGAFLLRQIFYGASRLFPPHRLHRYLRLEDSRGDPCTALRSAMLGGPMTLLSDPRNWASELRELFRREVALQRRSRRLFRDGRMYALLGRPDPRGWDAFQFQAGADSVLYAFRGDAASEPAVSVRLRGLDPAAGYEISDPDGGRTIRRTGAWLARRGLRVSLPPGGAAIREIHRHSNSPAARRRAMD